MSVDWWKQSPVPWQSLATELIPLKKIFLSSHLRPDADALGSELALADMLRQLGKEVTIVNPGASPDHLMFLDKKREIRSIADCAPGWSKDYDGIIVLDTSSWQQLGELAAVIKNSPAKKFVIDHHLSGDDLGALEFKDTSSPATGCLLFELAKNLGWQINLEVANSLFAAICTDTGWFRFPATTSNTYRSIAELIDIGVEPHAMYRELYEQGSLSKLQLSGTVLTRVQVDAEGRLAYTYVSQDDFKKTKSHPADTENLVNECLKIMGTEIAMIFVEQMNRTVKISFRSRGQYDVAKIAEKFSGGGHKLASGATTSGPLTECITNVVTYVKSAML
jgi:phosphoesterase RecJ-like protein